MFLFRKIIVAPAKLVQETYLARHVSRLVLVGIQTVIDHQISLLLVGPKLLLLTVAVVFYDRISAGKDIFEGSVVLLKLDDLGAFEILLKVQDIPDIRASPLIDALVIVTYHAKIPVLHGQQMYDLILDAVGVLILVHHDVSEALTVILKYVRIVPQKVISVEKKIVKIHGVVLLKRRLIVLVDSVIHLGGRSLHLHFPELLRIPVTLLVLAYDGGDQRERIVLGIDVSLFINVLQYRLLVHGVIHNKTGGVAHLLRVFSQHPQTHGVEGHDPHAGAYSHQFFHTVTHLPGSLVSEGHCQDVVGPYAFLDEVSDPVSHGLGLAGTGSR